MRENEGVLRMIGSGFFSLMNAFLCNNKAALSFAPSCFLSQISRRSFMCLYNFSIRMTRSACHLSISGPIQEIPIGTIGRLPITWATVGAAPAHCDRESDGKKREI